MKTTRLTDDYRQLDKTTDEDNQNNRQILQTVRQNYRWTTRITDRYYRQLDKTSDEDNQNNRQILQTVRQNYR